MTENDEKSGIKYKKQYEPIVLSKPLLDTLLKQKNPADLIALYTFYYYTAKWQDTKQAKATTGYTAKGLGWGEDRVRKNKKILIELELIEDITSRDPKTKQINGHYIYVKFIWSSEKITSSHPPGKPDCGSSQTVDNNQANSLSDNSLNALSDNNKDNYYSNNYTKTKGFLEKELPVNNSSRILPEYKDGFGKIAIKLIEYWSSLENTHNHITTYPYNKSCSKMIKDLVSLQKGTFNRGRQFDPDWVAKQEIPREWFNKPWTFPELKDGLDQAVKYSIEGYWAPGDKNENFRSLGPIIYNKWTRNSWLLAAIKNPPKSLKEVIKIISFPKTIDILIKNPIWPRDIVLDKYKLDSGLKELDNFSKKLIRDSYNKSHQYFGTLALLLKEYLAWIDENDWIEINQSIIGVNNGVFRKFIEAQSKEIGIHIKSKGWK